MTTDGSFVVRTPAAPSPAPPGQRIERPPRSYEELEGGVGREVNFRPRRYSLSDLGTLCAVVSVEIAQGIQQCALHNLSQGGVAFEWNREPPNVGETLPLLTLGIGRHEVYQGAVRVVSVREVDGTTVVGAAFLAAILKIEEVLELRDVKAWQGSQPWRALKDRPWSFPGHEHFRSRVGELRLLLQDAEKQLAELEASLPWHVVHGSKDSPATAELLDRVRSEFVADMLSVFVTVGEQWKPVTAAEHQPMKEYAIRNLREYFIRSPWLRRSKEKPLGYPGDYELMNGMYGTGAYAHLSGDTLFAKVMNLLVLDAPSSIAVVERKNLVKRRLSDLLDRAKPAGRPIRILSIAAGPAQETYELLKERECIPHPVDIVLFDQDKRALAFAHRRLEQLVTERWSERVRIYYLHDAIKRLLRDPKLFASFEEFDAIFSCGLFDYLQEPTAATLTASLYANVAPGGRLFIGNQTPRNPSRWAMESLCDWYLLYREHAEMLAFARAGAPLANVAIEEEKTGINPFVVLTRPRVDGT